MAHAIIERKGSKIKQANPLQEFFMARGQLLDVVRPSERLSIPFRFRWLKFKTGFFGLVLKRGAVQ